MKTSWGLLLLFIGGCATKPESISLSGLAPVHHAYASAAGDWSEEKGAVVSHVAEPVRPGAVADSMALIRGVTVQDLVISCRVTIEGDAVAGLLLHARETAGVVSAMHVLAVSAGGIDLWRLQDGRWTLLERHVMPITTGESHVLRLEARGDKITAEFDGGKLFEARDQFLLEKGGAGIYAREGVCRFESITVKSLERPVSKRESSE